MATFSGLEIARRALHVNQTSMNVIGHNIANAGTPGFSRQVVITSATGPYTSPSNIRPMKAGQIGTGVGIVAIKRQFDSYTATQFRLENALLSQWQMKQNAMEQIEAIFNEPSDSSMRKSVDDFWSALQQLAIEPTELSSRAVVRQSGVTMVDNFKTMDRQLEQIIKDYDELMFGTVGEVNSLLNQINDLNKRIVRVTAMGDEPNDLLDQRDLLLDQLTEIINVDLKTNARGDVQISFDGVVLVDFVDNKDHEIPKFDFENGTLSLGGNPIAPESIENGRMKGILEAQEAVQDYRDDLEEYAFGYINAINEQHRAGHHLNDEHGPIDFFVFTDDPPSIQNLEVNPLIMEDLSLIAAGGSEYPGDGQNAVEMAAIRHKKELEYGGKQVTFDEFYRSMVADLGIKTNETIQMTDNQRVLAHQFAVRQEMVRGVSIDEEMTLMVQYQHSYAAAGRLTNTIDEMIDLIVNRLGLVGR